MRQSLTKCTAFVWPLLTFLRPDLKSSGSQLSTDPKKIENWSVFDEATAHNVKSVKNCIGRFLKRRKKVRQVAQPFYDLVWPFWDQIWNSQGLSFLQTPKNHKFVHIWRRDSPKCKSCQKLIWQFFIELWKKLTSLIISLKN